MLTKFLSLVIRFSGSSHCTVEGSVRPLAFICSNLDLTHDCEISRLDSSTTLPSTTQWGSAEPLSRITKDASLQVSHLVLSDEAAVPRFGTSAKSRFEHLETSRLTLPPTTQCGSTKLLRRITKDARPQESHPVLSDVAAVP
ncbi:unnamed protein product, partial [Heterotrigona itama]